MRFVAYMFVGLIAACSFSSAGYGPPDDEPDAGGPGPDGPPDAIDADTPPTADAPFDAGPCMGGTAELCNGVDDDCDDQIDEGYALGGVCDGPDSDLCMEGTVVCALDGVSVQCTDSTSSTVETCDGMLDEDCDGTVDDGFDLATDEANCGSCGTLCENGYGTPLCTSGVCTPICSAGAQDCDGMPNNGCELRNSDPLCLALTTAGTVNGDAASTYVTSGYAESWVKVSIVESATGVSVPLRVRFDLSMPAGIDYDLYVYCVACGGALADSSTFTAGVTETVYIGRDDDFGVQTFDVMVEIRYYDANMCGDWTLTVVGNSATSERNCNP